ncbi:hypothetical protein ACHAWO_011949 [Cyclotella atomus]|uniref:60S ribosomal export protein NMD3 n=1 Tax=Cyclotella atomus TaxID=382360 RepID=A0ABD3PBV0_9STRA
MSSTGGLTTSLIPCCSCGTIIAPNPSNQCASCLATVDISSILRRGPGGGDLILHQCRKCRKYDRTGEGKFFTYLDQESPELMAVLLKLIPALSGKNTQWMRRSHGVETLSLLDSMFIWTEPNSMRMRLMLTVKADINEAPRTVSIQQRCKVEFIVQWRECPDCLKQSRQQTWQAIVQLRQKRADSDGGNKGLLILELAIARNAELRKHILQVQTKKSGFDFYFPSQDTSRHFCQYLAKVAPMRMKTSQSLVSEDRRNNTANVKHTISLDMVPLCRDDLVVVDMHSAKGVGRLSGRLCLVLKISSTVHLVDASPSRGTDMAACCSDLTSDNYWKGGEKAFRLLLSSRRLVRFTVLDVELCDNDGKRKHSIDDESDMLYNGPSSGISKYALADIEVARESDFGVNDETFRCVTHLGHLLNVGDVVLGYDLTSVVLSGGDEWSIENAFVNSFVMPDVVIVRKAKGAGGPAADGEPGSGKPKAKSSGSKKRDRRLQKEEKKQQRLQAAAARMGLDTDKDVHLDEEAFGEDNTLIITQAMEQVAMNDDLAEDLEAVERELRLIDASNDGDTNAGESDTP